MGFNIVAQCGNIIRSLSDAPNCTASELKECFDLIALPAVNAINDLISILESSASAGNLGAKNGTVQECIDSLESSVARIGDLSDVGSNEGLYESCAAAMNKMNGIVPWSFVPGNHDYDGICQSGTDHTASYMNAEGRFPVSKFKEFSYWGGAYDENLIQNTYYYLETGGVNYLFLMLDYYPTDDVLKIVGKYAGDADADIRILAKKTLKVLEKKIGVD